MKGISKIGRHEDTNILMFVSLLTLFLVHTESSWANVKTKKYGVKTFECSHCYKKFGLLLWQECLKFEDMKTQNYGVKTFSCSHCDKKFGLFWQESLKLERHEDTNINIIFGSQWVFMSTCEDKKAWSQDFWLLSLW